MSPRLPHPLLAVQSDGRLTELIERGHERAFEALVKRYRAPLLAYCRRLGLSEPQAEDVLQQSFTNAWLALGRGVEVREARPWLYRVVHNTAVSALRRPAEESEEPARLEQAAEPCEQQGAIEQGLAARDALGHVAALPPMQREALVLTALQGRSHEEAAGVLGVSDGAVRGLLHRARTTLRSAAAALTPQGLLAWLSRGPAVFPVAERSGELAVGGGAIGITGAALKGALVAATAGLLAAGGAGDVRAPRAPSSARAGTRGVVAVAFGMGSSGATLRPGVAASGLPGGSPGRARGAHRHTHGDPRGPRLGGARAGGRGHYASGVGATSGGDPAPGAWTVLSGEGSGSWSRSGAGLAERFRSDHDQDDGRAGVGAASGADRVFREGGAGGQSRGDWESGANAGTGESGGSGTGEGPGTRVGSGPSGSSRASGGSRQELQHGRFDGAREADAPNAGGGPGTTAAESSSGREQGAVPSRSDEQGAGSLEERGDG